MRESKLAGIMRNVAQIMAPAKINLKQHWPIPLLDDADTPLTQAEMREMMGKARQQAAQRAARKSDTPPTPQL